MQANVIVKLKIFHIIFMLHMAHANVKFKVIMSYTQLYKHTNVKIGCMELTTKGSFIVMWKTRKQINPNGLA